MASTEWFRLRNSRASEARRRASSGRSRASRRQRATSTGSRGEPTSRVRHPRSAPVFPPPGSPPRGRCRQTHRESRSPALPHGTSAQTHVHHCVVGPWIGLKTLEDDPLSQPKLRNLPLQQCPIGTITNQNQHQVVATRASGESMNQGRGILVSGDQGAHRTDDPSPLESVAQLGEPTRGRIVRSGHGTRDDLQRWAQRRIPGQNGLPHRVRDRHQTVHPAIFQVGQPPLPGGLSTRRVATIGARCHGLAATAKPTARASWACTTSCPRSFPSAAVALTAALRTLRSVPSPRASHPNGPAMYSVPQGFAGPP
jgi:hypothetical protein